MTSTPVPQTSARTTLPAATGAESRRAERARMQSAMRALGMGVRVLTERGTALPETGMTAVTMRSGATHSCRA